MNVGAPHTHLTCWKSAPLRLPVITARKRGIMSILNQCLSKPTRLGACLVLTLALLLPAVTAQAGEMVVKGKNVQSKAEAKWMQIGENKKHGIGTYHGVGLTFLDNGEIATYTDQGTYEWRNGIGTHRGYVIKTYPDGSTTVDRYQGTDKSIGDLSVSEGTFTFESGTGKFKGIEGKGTYKGTRYGNGMSIIDYEAKVTVPD